MRSVSHALLHVGKSEKNAILWVSQILHVRVWKNMKSTSWPQYTESWIISIHPPHLSYQFQLYIHARMWCCTFAAGRGCWISSCWDIGWWVHTHSTHMDPHFCIFLHLHTLEVFSTIWTSSTLLRSQTPKYPADMSTISKHFIMHQHTSEYSMLFTHVTQNICRTFANIGTSIHLIHQHS